ncbi:hypothetical protein HBO38_35050 [Pseudomonas veronii]|uniref:Uncharacterized protein n=1 Tax=Pseudomonas veronii TaxID=76761 RepID=A0A7Y1AD32_PSEVE|nr:hypothetical protein [Pseudomonas veronii]NMY13544.1 hypothetical protein [Pseudomonas veronii]
MNYNEFTSYLADRIMAVRIRERVPGCSRRRVRYYDAAYASVLECRAFFDRISLDEGPHNDYDPTSRASVEAYRVAMYAQIAEELGTRVADACVRGNESFLNTVFSYPVCGQDVSDQRFARVAAEHLANIYFERTCAGCGAKYRVSVQAQTYRMISNYHPETCAAVRVAPVQAAKPEVKVTPDVVVQAKPEVRVKAQGGEVEPMMIRLMRWEARQKNIKGPVIPQELLDPTQKPAFNSPEYRANAQAALRLYAEFLKFYEEDPSPKSKSENNQRELERMYKVVICTVFNFDPNANKKQ